MLFVDLFLINSPENTLKFLELYVNLFTVYCFVIPSTL